MGGGSAHRRVLVHASGFRQSPYADIKPPGENTRDTRRMVAAETAGPESSAVEEARREEARREEARREEARREDARREEVRREEVRRRSEPPRKLWHASPGSSGR